MGSTQALTGPDLSEGVAFDTLEDHKPLVGHARGEAVLLVRDGRQVYATGATCSHYGGPLGEGLVADGQIHCPWHHACFDLRTGQGSAPALDAIACYEVERRGALVRVTAKKTPPRRPTPVEAPASVVIIGAGAAGSSCAETLRSEGYEGPITLLGAEPTAPVDRPNLSKDYLAGSASEDWIPLRSDNFYQDNKLALERGAPALGIDPRARVVQLAGGRTQPYGALLLATGAEPVRLPIEGATRPHVHTLRTLADSRAIIAGAGTARSAAILGASFIGLEAAASLRARGLDVTVIAPELVPLARVLGEGLGAFVRSLHEAKGVTFRLGCRPTKILGDSVVLDDGTSVRAELVVMGVGVKPRVELARGAGLSVGDGVVVDELLRTTAPGIYAAGDIASFPYDGGRARVEHWHVARRQGQAVARAMLGRGKPYRDVPFFWSAHPGVTIAYVGHAPRWDEVETRGTLASHDALVALRFEGKIRAIVTIGRDRASLEAERLFERGDQAGLEAYLAQA